MLKKCLTAAALTGVLCISSHSFAETMSGSSSVLSPQAAEAVINEYKTLRQSCSTAQNEARKNCINSLSDLNERYNTAKKTLGLQKTPEKNQIHYVTFAQ